MHVSAKDLGTGREQRMTVTGGSVLPKDSIERMMRDAEQYAEEDRRHREAAGTRNRAERLVHATGGSLAEGGDKVPGGVRSEVEAAVADLKEKLKGGPTEADTTGNVDNVSNTDNTDNTAAIREAAEKVATTSQKPGRALYADARGRQQIAGGAQAGGGAGGDVVDAEITDEDRGERREGRLSTPARTRRPDRRRRPGTLCGGSGALSPVVRELRKGCAGQRAEKRPVGQPGRRCRR
ncbi:hypothetical protein CUT44_32405 [Streptomyces carminius]|uniref:Molecular chaperone DnaK n=1 Tax=Streptomyces carminius TaxID=2665496 RepID=A0A2M8LPT5_9ACTN|nr:hypothetical protein CUT44_32405 [Streptomyces carminius]